MMSETKPTSAGTSTAGQLSERAALASAARARIQAVVDAVKADGGDVADALELLLLGGDRVSDRPESVSRQGASLRALWAGSLTEEVEESGVPDLLRGDRAFSELVMREMAEPETTGDASARRTADLFSRYLAYMARELDACGAPVGGLRGYVPHNHDSLKIRRIGEKAWVKHVARWIDQGRTFPGLEPEAIPAALSEVFQALITGKRPTWRHGINPFLPPDPAGADARQDCILYFNSAESAVAYNRRFASGGITRSMLRVIDSFARRAALMRVFGPDPEAMIHAFLEREASSLPSGDAGRERVLAVERCLRALAGESGTPENLTAARVATGKRALKGMIRLGEAFASSFADIAAKLGTKEGYWDNHDELWLEEWDTGLRERLTSFTPREQGELARRLDVYGTALLGELYGTFDLADARSGDMTRWMNAWYALCDPEYWLEPHRAASIISFSHRLARFAVAGREDADERLATALRDRGLHDKGLLDRLDLLQKMVEEVEGEPYLFPENVSRLTDADLEAPEAVRSQATSLPPQQGEEAAARARLRETLARDLTDLFVEELVCVVRDPAIKNHACPRDMVQVDPLTAQLRDLSNKLGKSCVFWWQRETTRPSALLPPEEFLEGVPGFIHFFTACTVIGMVSLTARAVAAGRDEPNDWTEPLLPTMLAILNSGAFGILGHFYLGMASRFNKRGWFGFSPQVAEALAGMSDLSARLARGEFPDKGEEAVRRALDDLPFANLLYTRQAMEYMIYSHIMNAFACRAYTKWDAEPFFDGRNLNRLEAFSNEHSYPRTNPNDE